MSITDILIRSISGYIFVFPVILLYFIYLNKQGKKESLQRILIVFIFCYYIIGIFTMTGINSFDEFSPRLVLIPFIDMIRGPVDTILNIILFIPLGFFIPLLYKKFNDVKKIGVVGFILSLLIEFVQMFGMGATDINDLITNTIGACIGYFIYKIIKGKVEMKIDNNRADVKELLFFIGYSFIVMLTVQPIVISKLFNLG